MVGWASDMFWLMNVESLIKLGFSRAAGFAWEIFKLGVLSPNMLQIKHADVRRWNQQTPTKMVGKGEIRNSGLHNSASSSHGALESGMRTNRWSPRVLKSELIPTGLIIRRRLVDMAENGWWIKIGLLHDLHENLLAKSRGIVKFSVGDFRRVKAAQIRNHCRRLRSNMAKYKRGTD